MWCRFISLILSSNYWLKLLNYAKLGGEGSVQAGNITALGSEDDQEQAWPPSPTFASFKSNQRVLYKRELKEQQHLPYRCKFSSLVLS